MTTKSSKPIDVDKVPMIVSVKEVKNEHSKIVIWNTLTGKPLNEISTESKDYVTGIAKTHDSRLISISSDSYIKLYY